MNSIKGRLEITASFLHFKQDKISDDQLTEEWREPKDKRWAFEQIREVK